MEEGQPYGRICPIVSKSISFQPCYACDRCISVKLTDSNTLLSNVYFPYDDSRNSVEVNVESIMRAIGHLDAAHELNGDITKYITVGDFSVDPSDRTKRSKCVEEFMQMHNYVNSDTKFYSTINYYHKSGRLIDRFISSANIFKSVNHATIPKTFRDSDHFPIITKVPLSKAAQPCKKKTIN